MTAPRTYTPNRTDADGSITLNLKRACNGCGELLGDPDDRDADENGELTDVRAECTNCRPLVDLEAAGCRTWRFLIRDLYEVLQEIDELGVFREGYAEHVDGRTRFVGVSIGEQPEQVVARFGDWIVYHPDGRWTVHPAPANQEESPK